MKPFSQNFEDLTQYDNVINPKLAPKGAQTHISCTGNRKMKINFEVRYLFMKLF